MNKKLLIIFFFIFHCFNGYCIDLNKIKQIESNNNPLAYNKRSGARGLYQITKICLDEYNHLHKIKYTQQDLFNAEINEKIAKWYFNRILFYFKRYNIQNTDKNILIAYHDGISNLIKYLKNQRSLGREMLSYISKYEKS